MYSVIESQRSGSTNKKKSCQSTRFFFPCSTASGLFSTCRRLHTAILLPLALLANTISRLHRASNRWRSNCRFGGIRDTITVLRGDRYEFEGRIR